MDWSGSGQSELQKEKRRLADVADEGQKKTKGYQNTLVRQSGVLSEVALGRMSRRMSQSNPGPEGMALSRKDRKQLCCRKVGR